MSLVDPFVVGRPWASPADSPLFRWDEAIVRAASDLLGNPTHAGSMVLIGPRGSGKTSLARYLMALMGVSQGVVFRNVAALDDLTPGTLCWALAADLRRAPAGRLLVVLDNFHILALGNADPQELAEVRHRAGWMPSWGGPVCTSDTWVAGRPWPCSTSRGRTSQRTRCRQRSPRRSGSARADIPP